MKYGTRGAESLLAPGTCGARRPYRVAPNNTSAADDVRRACGGAVCGRTRVGPASEHARDDARRRPVALSQARQGITAAAPGARTRPVVRRRQPAVPGAPFEHGIEHALSRPPTLDRAGVAGLAVRVGIALAVPRLSVRAAPSAHADVAGLDPPRFLAGGVVEVRLDGRGRAAEPVRDLPDREPLDFAVVPRDRASATARRRSTTRRFFPAGAPDDIPTRYCSQWRRSRTDRRFAGDRRNGPKALAAPDVLVGGRRRVSGTIRRLRRPSGMRARRRAGLCRFRPPAPAFVLARVRSEASV